MVALGRLHRITKIQQKFNHHIFLLEKCFSQQIQKMLWHKKVWKRYVHCFSSLKRIILISKFSFFSNQKYIKWGNRKFVFTKTYTKYLNKMT